MLYRILSRSTILLFLGFVFRFSLFPFSFQVLLYEATGNAKYSNGIQAFINEWKPSGSVQYTPGGLAWRAKWGSNRYAGKDEYIF